MKKRIIFAFFIVLFFTSCGVNRNDVKVTKNEGLIIKSDLKFNEDYNELDDDLRFQGYEYPTNLSNYEIEVKLDDSKKTIYCTQTVEYVNNTGVDLNEIYFNIYPNAYKSEETAPCLYGVDEGAPNGFNKGEITFEKINTNGEECEYSIEGEDETKLRISLESRLSEGEKINIYFEYSVAIPTVMDRIGYHEGAYNVAHWFPIAAVYEKEVGWVMYPFYNIGEPFYSEVANYEVTIDVPEEMIVASTGSVKSLENNDGRKKYKFSEKAIRDFAWVGNKDFRVKTEFVDGIKIKGYSLGSEKELERMMTVATESIEAFNEAFGKYPYSTYSVVDAYFSAGGMEYPGLVYISEKYINKRFYEDIIAHETAHQWWYGIVGNNEATESWLDESLASYSENTYYLSKNGVGKSEFKKETNIENHFNQGFEDNSILRRVDKFESMNDYGMLVYREGQYIFDDIMEEVGYDTFLEILQKYYSKYKFKVAKTEDFINVVEEVTGEEWDEFFNMWLNHE